MTVRRSVVRGVGAYLPARVMTNDELSRTVATDDAWIRQRTGIRERHIAAEGEYTSHLGLAAEEQPGTMKDRGVLTTQLRSDGRYREKLYVDGGPSTTGTAGHLRMEGREVFRYAVGMITDVVEASFKATGYGPNDIDWFV